MLHPFVNCDCKSGLFTTFFRVWFLMTSIMVTFASTWIGLITIDYWLKAESTSLWEIVTLCLLSVGWLMAINAVFMTVGSVKIVCVQVLCWHVRLRCHGCPIG